MNWEGSGRFGLVARSGPSEAVSSSRGSDVPAMSGAGLSHGLAEGPPRCELPGVPRLHPSPVALALLIQG